MTYLVHNYIKFKSHDYNTTDNKCESNNYILFLYHNIIHIGNIFIDQIKLQYKVNNFIEIKNICSVSVCAKKM